MHDSDARMNVCVMCKTAGSTLHPTMIWLLPGNGVKFQLWLLAQVQAHDRLILCLFFTVVHMCTGVFVLSHREVCGQCGKIKGMRCALLRLCHFVFSFL